MKLSHSMRHSGPTRCSATTKLMTLCAVVAFITLDCPLAMADGASPAASCAKLAQLAVPEATITMAEAVAPREFKLPARNDNPGGPGGGSAPGGPPGQGAPGGNPGPVGPPANGGAASGPAGPPGGGMNMQLAPFYPSDTTNHAAFCRVAATLRPSGDSNIKIEIWLPLEHWNGKLMGAGDFGWAGSIMYGGLLLGLEHGYATVSTDTGHDNSLAMGQFALGHPDKMIDYGYRAAHTMTVDAKVFIKAFYGRAPEHAYWYGCSLGGQMGLTEIQRFPEDYDGAIIGAPASPIVDLNAYQIWPSLLIAQKPARELGRTKATMLAQAVMNACDALDGAKDGEIDDPTACHFDVKSLQCPAADNDNCLTEAQVEFVQMLYTGPVDPKTGQKLYEGAVPGMESGFGNYSASGPMGVAVALFKYMVFQDPNWDWKTLDMSRDMAYGREVLRTINISDNPNLKPFFDRGGKLLWYHGWLDAGNPLEGLKYYKAVRQAIGAAQTDRSFRFFTMPGMGHCSGGTGCDVFDKLSELDHWIESGKAPERIVASKLQDGKVIRTHPLCAYPAVAHYSGSGDLNDAANFACVSK